VTVYVWKIVYTEVTCWILQIISHMEEIIVFEKRKHSSK